MTPDAKLLATGSADGVVRVWRTDGGMPLPTVRTHQARARTAFYSLDGEHLVTASEDHTALHWMSGHLTPSVPRSCIAERSPARYSTRTPRAF